MAELVDALAVTSKNILRAEEKGREVRGGGLKGMRSRGGRERGGRGGTLGIWSVGMVGEEGGRDEES